MRPQPSGKTKSRITRAGLVQPVAAYSTQIPEWDSSDEMDLADVPAYYCADRYHHIQPGDACEEDLENAQAEISALFRCAD